MLELFDEFPDNEMHLSSYGASIDESENEAKYIVDFIQENSN
ncbi:hypothetical protein [Aliikangiella coralliicola]|nr:hypothetical protein [Aliikangiella coralliicola]